MKKTVLIFMLFVSIVLASCDKNDNSVYGNFPDGDTNTPDGINSGHIGGGGGGSSSSNDTNSTTDSDFLQKDDGETTENDNSLYDLNPNIEVCESGHIKLSEKESVLIYINSIRKLHNLPPVKYNFNDDDYVEQCSLIIASNRILTHHPEANSKCYTKTGADGCAKSNIFIRQGSGFSISSQDIINTYLTDENVAELGHRRWILYPWLNTIAFSRVDTKTVTGSALKVLNTTFQKLPDNSPDFVAYPFHDYPSKLFSKNVSFSFSVIYNKQVPQNNAEVDFSKVKITITDANNKKYEVEDITFDNANYGIPNILIWKIKTDSITKNLKYTVKIEDLIVDKTPKNYEFWFSLSK